MEQRIIPLQIADEYIMGAGGSVGAVGSHDDVLLEMDFRSSALWAGTTRRAVFANALGEAVEPIILTTNLLEEGQSDVYLVPVPAEAKSAAGECFLTVEGVIIESGQEILRAVTEEVTFRVLPSRLYTGESAITPDAAEQLQAEIDEIREDLAAIPANVEAAAGSAEAAAQSEDAAAQSEDAAAGSAAAAAGSATAAGNSANTARSWAVGGTGTREGEDTNNAKYWSEQARQIAGGGVTSFNGRSGAVKPQTGDYTAEMVGAAAAIHAAQHGADGSDPINPAMIGAARKSNLNLLPNWYFPDPVDSRGGYVVPPGKQYYVLGGQTPSGTLTDYATVIGYKGPTQGDPNTYPVVIVNGAQYVVYDPSNANPVVRGYTGEGYTINRWRWDTAGGIMLIVSGGIKLIRPQGQNVALVSYADGYQRFAGKDVTLSFLTDKGCYSKSFSIPEVKPNVESYPNYAGTDTDIGHIAISTWPHIDGLCVFLNSADAVVHQEVTPIAAKLEFGLEQTIAYQDANGNWVLNDPPPDKTIEEFRCIHSYAGPADPYANKPVDAYSYGTTDLTAGTSTLETGKLYFVYE